MKIDYRGKTMEQVEALARADERTKMAKLHAKIWHQLQGLLAMLPLADAPASVPTPKPARKPRTVKLDEGIVAAILDRLPSDEGLDAGELFIRTRMASRKQFGNYLVKLVVLGKVHQEGKGKNARYRLAEPSRGGDKPLDDAAEGK